jgi:hypothetical protein
LTSRMGQKAEVLGHRNLSGVRTAFDPLVLRGALADDGANKNT